MDSLDKKVIAGIAIAAVFTISLYAYLAGEQERGSEPLDSKIVDRCRELLREGADILVQVARDDLNPDSPDDAFRLAEFEGRIADIETEMDKINCRGTQDQWTYGSFKQEMSEYEAYIAELVRKNSEQ